MPRIFDNIDLSLMPALQDTLKVSHRADFCVGYFNLRGWRLVDALIEEFSGGGGQCCRLLIGMQRLPHDELKTTLSILKDSDGIDQQEAHRLSRRMAEEFREQLVFGVPTDADEAGLRRLSVQLKAKKVIVKLFLRHPLHAKLYLCCRQDPNNPTIGFLGSSNLTLAGLSKQGELNVDVLDHDACNKLQKWFDDRWNDRWCIDISADLIQVIDTSWAREGLIPPYYIYLKMAYHLSQEARAGLAEFHIPHDLEDRLFEFQKAAVKIAAHHINKRNGVLIGDVVGLGKTLMATALARVFDDDFNYDTLIICPRNLVRMWESYRDDYRLHAKVLSITRVTRELEHLQRYRLLIIDESHNLRNREGVRYRAIHEYIQKNDSKCILLSATPYNKTYLDLSNQLRMFVAEDRDLGVRPEQLIRQLGGEVEFQRRHQCLPRTLAAFEKSESTDDWRELMRLYMVRRTRSFIQTNYAQTDPENGRRFLTFQDGSRSYFPERIPKKAAFDIRDGSPDDQYARLYSDNIVETINHLCLPRYGLGNYIHETPETPPTPQEINTLGDLSRAGKRLMGFCRTNLFKRLESSGWAFLQSIERHILRNYVYLHAIENGLPLPLGSQGAELLDSRFNDEDADDKQGDLLEDDDENGEQEHKFLLMRTEEEFQIRAAEIFGEYRTRLKSRFKWLRPSLFEDTLAKHLLADINLLMGVIRACGDWQPGKDEKLNTLENTLVRQHPKEKLIVFTQFADTARYLAEQLKGRGLSRIEAVTGDANDPTSLVWRFSPVSNNRRDRIAPGDELRVLVATDILSEGQNLQDCAIVVNYDLPWAIIRLIQRAGRVDRIGQQADKILCYSFLPAEGVERIIRLRERIRTRLKENAEVVGTDEAFFEDDKGGQSVVDLYNEKDGALDEDLDSEVDLASYAYQIWKNATDADPALKTTIEEMPSVVYATRPYAPTDSDPEGVMVYVRTSDDNDALAWIDRNGNSVTESQFRILKMAECGPETPALPRLPNHHELVRNGVQLIGEQERNIGGQLGRPTGARFKTYERLKAYVDRNRDSLFVTPELLKAIEDVYRYPLCESAKDALNRQLRTHISDEDLVSLVLSRREEGHLCLIQEEQQSSDPRIICSMGLSAVSKGA